MDGDVAHPLKDSILTDEFFDGNKILNPLAGTFDNQDVREIRASERGGNDITGEIENNQTPTSPQQLAQFNGGDGDATEPSTSVRKAGPGEFELLKVIGMGAFGQVLQVRSRRNGQILAMKCISKKMLERRNHIAYMQAERDIMTKVMHPFVVRLQCAFQTERKLFLVMEYLPGGELFFHLEKKGLFLEDSARFYAAEMVLALEHLHSKGIIHRDLKPENLLLGANGHICLTDFGLAKELTDAEDEGLKTICGTNEYMAPEMILRKGYGKAVDWWSMGALVYEMTSGYPPFRGKTPRDLNRKILNERVSLPKWLSPTAHQVLRGFLERNVSRRLGAKKTTMFEIGGATAVKQHPFFAHIDWVKLAALQLDPPLKPDVISPTDTSNFSTEFLQMALPKSLSHESLLSHAESLGQPAEEEGDTRRMFRGFSFVAETFIEGENCQSTKDGDGFILMESNEGPRAGEVATASVSGISASKKKVKGKRVRHKKGKAKNTAGDMNEKIQSASTTVNQENGDEAPSLRPGASLSTGAFVTSGSPVSTSRDEGDLIVRQPVGEAECKPSALAAMLADQTEKGSLSRPTPIGVRRPNVWAARELPAPAPVPTPAGPPRGQPRRTLAMSVSNAGTRVTGGSTDALPGHRGNVWAARELPAPAPVPTPAGPPRGQPRRTLAMSVSNAGTRVTGGSTDALPGHRGGGNTFVWKRPV